MLAEHFGDLVEEVGAGALGLKIGLGVAIALMFVFTFLCGAVAAFTSGRLLDRYHHSRAPDQ